LAVANHVRLEGYRVITTVAGKFSFFPARWRAIVLDSGSASRWYLPSDDCRTTRLTRSGSRWSRVRAT